MSVVFQFFLSLFRGSDPLTHQCLFSTNNVPGTNSGSSNAAAESNCQFFFSWTDILQSIREDARRCLFICQSTHIFLSISILFCFVFLMVLENEPKVMYIRDKCSATELDPSTYITVCPSLIINCYQLWCTGSAVRLRFYCFIHSQISFSSICFRSWTFK